MKNIMRSTTTSLCTSTSIEAQEKWLHTFNDTLIKCNKEEAKKRHPCYDLCVLEANNNLVNGFERFDNLMGLDFFTNRGWREPSDDLSDLLKPHLLPIDPSPEVQYIEQLVKM